MTPLEWLNEFQVNVVDNVGGDNDQNQSQVIQLSNGNMLVAWVSNADPASGPGSSTNNDVIGRIFDPFGNAVSGEIQLNSIAGGFSTGANFPSIDALPGGGFTVTYRSVDSGVSSVDVSIEADVYSNSGAFQRHVNVIADNGVSSAAGLLEAPRVAAASDTSAFVIYGNDGDVKGTVYNPSTGAIISADFMIANQTVGDFHGADVVEFSPSLYIVAFADRDPGNDQVFYALYNASGTAITTSPQLIDSSFADASDPRVAVLSNGDFVVSWEVDGSGGTNTGVRFAIMENFGVGFTVGPIQNPLTTLTGNQPHSNVVALEEGGFIVAWYDENTHDLLAQRHDNAGAKVGSEFAIINFGSSTVSGIDMAQMEDGRIQFAFTRTSSGDADVLTSIWDPRADANDTPVYPGDAIIGTPLSDTINPLPSGALSYYGAGGNDTFWISDGDQLIGATFDGGTGTDTVGLVEPGDFNFFSGGTDTAFIDVETFKFNAGGPAGTKTASLTQLQALQFDTFDFAQGGATRPDVLNISDFNTGNTFDLSGLGIVDFESLHDEIHIRGFGGNDNITGTVTNDIIYGGTGLDTLDGDAGFDTLNTTGEGYSGNVSINLTSGAISSSQGAEAAVNFENFQGGNANETVIGTSAHANIMRGGNGADTFTGGNQADQLFGEGGNDTFIINSPGEISAGPVDLMDGGTGTDTIAVGQGSTIGLTYNLRNESLVSIEAINFLGQFGGSTLTDRVQLSANQFNSGDIALTSNIDGVNSATRNEILDVFMTSESSLDLSGLTFTNWGGQSELVRIIGDSTGETITGTTQDDEIFGNGGADILNGAGGNDIFNAGSGDDVITVDITPDTVDAGLGDDTIIVTNFSGAGHDIDGGGNTDTVSFTTFGQAYTINLGAGTWTQNSTGNPVTASLVSIENVSAGSGGDTITGANGVNNVLLGGGGNDVISGGTGNNILDGEGGNDRIIRGTGNALEDEYRGGTGVDTFVTAGLSSSVTIDLDAGEVLLGASLYEIASGFENYEGSGNETVIGTGGDNLIAITGSGNNKVEDGGGSDIVATADGDDTFYKLNDAGVNTDTFDGGLGNDSLIFGNLAGGFSGTSWTLNLETGSGQGGGSLDTLVLSNIENVTGGGGNDTITGEIGVDNVLNGGGGNDTLVGGLASSNTLNGGAGNDTLTINGTAPEVANGDEGDDLILFSSGAASNPHTVDGGDDTDTLQVGFTNSAVIDLEAGTAQITTTSGVAVNISNVENVRGGGGSEIITGSNGVDNLLEGQAGDDTLEGLSGADTLDGGANTGAGDTASYANSNAAVTVNLSTNIHSGGHAAGDSLLQIENIIGSAFGDNLTGDNNANILDGGNGADTLNGLGGDDILRGGFSADILLGGDGNDLLEGSFANDIIDGGNDIDTADYTGFGGGVTVNLSTTAAQNTGAGGTDTISNVENLLGGQFNDRLTGSVGAGGDNVLDGGDGSDFLFGLGGADTLLGGGLNDNIQGGGGMDHLEGGAGLDTLLGGSGVDTLLGNDGNDQLRGGTDSDTLTGGLGRDVLIGGDVVGGGFPGDGAADTFVINDVAESSLGGATRDIIRDFEDGLDIMQLSGIDAISGGGDNAFTFIGAANFSNAAGELRAFNTGGNTVVRGDVDGDGVGDLEIFLNGTLALDAGDFIL